jgi:hypothetical protein
MAETTWRDGSYLIRETVGDHTPQTPRLIKEFGEVCDGISRSYDMRINFDTSPFQTYLGMVQHWCAMLPEDYRTVWTGYVVEPDYVNGSPVQRGHVVKGWFFCYRRKEISRLTVDLLH